MTKYIVRECGGELNHVGDLQKCLDEWSEKGYEILNLSHREVKSLSHKGVVCLKYLVVFQKIPSSPLVRRTQGE